MKQQTNQHTIFKKEVEEKKILRIQREKHNYKVLPHLWACLSKGPSRCQNIYPEYQSKFPGRQLAACRNDQLGSAVQAACRNCTCRRCPKTAQQEPGWMITNSRGHTCCRYPEEDYVLRDLGDHCPAVTGTSCSYW